MEKEIKKKLEELVTLLKDTDETVMIKEVLEKLERILLLANHPEEILMEKAKLKKRMEEIVALVNNTMIDLDINVEYCIPDVETRSDTCDVSSNSHILLTYSEDEYTTRMRKVSLGKTALQSTLEDLAKHVNLAIEEFKDEIDDIKMG